MGSPNIHSIDTLTRDSLVITYFKPLSIGPPIIDTVSIRAYEDDLLGELVEEYNRSSDVMIAVYDSLYVTRADSSFMGKSIEGFENLHVDIHRTLKGSISRDFWQALPILMCCQCWISREPILKRQFIAFYTSDSLNMRADISFCGTRGYFIEENRIYKVEDHFGAFFKAGIELNKFLAEIGVTSTAKNHSENSNSSWYNKKIHDYLKNQERGSISSLIFYDIKGHLMEEISGNPANPFLKMKNRPDGIYFIKIKTNEKLHYYRYMKM